MSKPLAEMTREFTRGLFALPRTEDGWDQVAASLTALLERVAGEKDMEWREAFGVAVDMTPMQVADHVIALKSVQLAAAQKEVEGWKNQAQEIALSNADHVRWHREQETLTRPLVEALRRALPYVESSAEAYHMLDGFGPRTEMVVDKHLDSIKRALAAYEEREHGCANRGNCTGSNERQAEPPVSGHLSFKDWDATKARMIGEIRASEKISGQEMQQRIGGEPQAEAPLPLGHEFWPCDDPHHATVHCGRNAYPRSPHCGQTEAAHKPR